eukprot:4291494-Amphidinium_carterae.4
MSIGSKVAAKMMHLKLFVQRGIPSNMELDLSLANSSKAVCLYPCQTNGQCCIDSPAEYSKYTLFKI